MIFHLEQRISKKKTILEEYPYNLRSPHQNCFICPWILGGETTANTYCNITAITKSQVSESLQRFGAPKKNLSARWLGMITPTRQIAWSYESFCQPTGHLQELMAYVMHNDIVKMRNNIVARMMQTEIELLLTTPSEAKVGQIRKKTNQENCLQLKLNKKNRGLWSR